MARKTTKKETRSFVRSFGCLPPPINRTHLEIRMPECCRPFQDIFMTKVQKIKYIRKKKHVVFWYTHPDRLTRTPPHDLVLHAPSMSINQLSGAWLQQPDFSSKMLASVLFRPWLASRDRCASLTSSACISRTTMFSPQEVP